MAMIVQSIRYFRLIFINRWAPSGQTGGDCSKEEETDEILSDPSSGVQS